MWLKQEAHRIVLFFLYYSLKTYLFDESFDYSLRLPFDRLSPEVVELHSNLIFIDLTQ